MVLITVLYILIGVALRRSTITTSSYQHQQQQQQQQPSVSEATPPPPPAGAPTMGAGRVTRVTPARVAQSRKSIFKMLGEFAFFVRRSTALFYSCVNRRLLYAAGVRKASVYGRTILTTYNTMAAALALAVRT